MAKTVYLDYANWIDLSREKAIFDKFKGALENEMLTPVLSFIHILELVNTREKSRRELSRFFDRINEIRGLRWIKGLTSVKKLEIKNAFENWLYNRENCIFPFENHLVDVMAHNNLSWIDDTTARCYSIERLSEIVLKDPKVIEDHKRFKKQYPSYVQVVSNSRKRHNQARFKEKEKKKWISDLLPSKIELTNGILYRITDNDRSSFVNEINLSFCPAFAALLAYYEGQNLTPIGTKSSSVYDFYHLVGVAYCDISFVDNHTHNLLRQGRYQKLPLKNSEFKKWVGNIKMTEGASNE